MPNLLSSFAIIFNVPLSSNTPEARLLSEIEKLTIGSTILLSETLYTEYIAKSVVFLHRE